MNRFKPTLIRLTVLTVLTICTAKMSSVLAFAPDTYSEHSVLSSGRWIKISVPSSGLYMITASDLRKYGFSDPASVRVVGYGGQRISDLLTEANYTDDLTVPPQEVTSRGIVFYALGPETYSRSTLPGQGPVILHSLNPFSTDGYYFLTDEGGAADPMPSEGLDSGSYQAVVTYDCPIFHEVDQISPGQSGHLLVGEDFINTRSRTFSFDTPDAAEGGLRLQVRFIAAASASSRISVAVNGTMLDEDNSCVLAAVTKSAYATQATVRRNIDIPVSDRTSITVSYTPGGTVKLAALDAINITYNRHLRLHDGHLTFSLNSPTAKLEGATSTTRVWDVTDHASPVVMRTSSDGSGITWTSPYGGERSYVAWNEGAQLPSPQFVGQIPNQDLHGEPVPDMVIITPAEWRSQANRVAALHRRAPESMRVLVVSDEEVFNEFSSGTPDVGAFRRLLKMMYDRGTDAEGHRLQHVMLFGRATHDNRQLTSQMKLLRERTLVGWSSDEGLTENTSYCSDDILSMLMDGAGQRMPVDTYCIGVGRVPAGTIDEATAFVDKLYRYVDNSKPGPWKNRVMFVADDGDSGIHLEQSEHMERFMRAYTSGKSMVYDKVYIDAYDEVGGASVVGREIMHRNLEEGTLWWNYIGHANKESLTSERILIYNDFNTVKWRQLPFLYAATCSFNRWDGIEKSGAEILFHNPYGGIIATLCPTREVFISENGHMSDAIGRTAWVRDDKGRYLTIGEIYRRAKNNVLTDSSKTEPPKLSTSPNKLRFALMGDPAMRLAVPDAGVRIDSINGEAVTSDSQPTLMARQQITVTGAVTSPVDGSVLTGFNGTLTAVLYDAEKSITTKGRDSDDTSGKVCVFESQGDMLYTGSGNVREGIFNLSFSMPETVADNFRPAALNLFAEADDGTEAISCFRSLYVYGYDFSAAPDSVAPVIEYAYLNHPSFNDGDIVNQSPMFIARVTDDTGINISTAGIGRRMTIRIDGKDNHADLAPYYSPLSGGEIGGTIAYPLENIQPGPHTLAFRVWDTGGNSSTHTLSFNVSDRIAPKIFEVYTDANPASTHANFYLSHNRPDAELTVTVEVFALNGRRVWSSTVTNRSDMFTSSPVTWDLCDQGGHRVTRGIYLYRATVTCEGQTTEAPVRRLAVTGH